MATQAFLYFVSISVDVDILCRGRGQDDPFPWLKLNSWGSCLLVLYGSICSLLCLFLIWSPQFAWHYKVKESLP